MPYLLAKQPFLAAFTPSFSLPKLPRVDLLVADVVRAVERQQPRKKFKRLLLAVMVLPGICLHQSHSYDIVVSILLSHAALLHLCCFQEFMYLLCYELSCTFVIWLHEDESNLAERQL